MEGITEGVMRSDFFSQDSAGCRMEDTAERRQGFAGRPTSKEAAEGWRRV